MRYGKGHQCGGGFEIAFAAVDDACLTQSIALGIDGGGATLRHLADVEQQLTLLCKGLNGSDKRIVAWCIAVAVALQNQGLGAKVGQTV